ncbi:hypothetical protein LXL04_036891 [Taraxacum kok-saghyz]
MANEQPVLPADDRVRDVAVNAPVSSSSSSSGSSASILTSESVSDNGNNGKNLSNTMYDDDDDEEGDVCRICRIILYDPRLITKWCEIQGQTKQQSVTSNLTSKSRYACKVTLAHLKDKPAHALSSSSSSIGISNGVKSTAAKLLGGGNGSRALSFVGGNGGSKSSSGTTKVGSLGDPSFPVIKDQNQFLSHMHDIARYQILYILLYNPIARWHICQGSINSIAFSSDGAYIAIVGSDGAYIAINST